MTALEHMVRSFARRTTQNGVVVLVTNGQPALVSAFQELGWPDPYPDPLLLPAVEAPPVMAVGVAPKSTSIFASKGKH